MLHDEDERCIGKSALKHHVFAMYLYDRQGDEHPVDP